ncbi:MAG: HAD hydrolase-like protein [Clostridiales bacterium]|nr:HAD hydrolase-like protein [Clostridiales bacterium]
MNTTQKTGTKYRILVLDHDDTSVHSTPEINWPAFVDTLSKLRPGVTFTYDEFMELCFDPGFDDLCRKILRFNEEEMVFEVANWKRFGEATVPTGVDGIRGIVEAQRRAGGVVAVVSHSVEKTIRRDWNARFGTLPDVIYAWDDDPLRRKPSPFPLADLTERFGCSPSDILVVDDLKHGYDMAAAAGCDFAYAGWAESARSTRLFMRDNASHYLETPKDLEELLFSCQTQKDC